MDFIKIAICDDEKNIRAYLASLVRKQGRECEIAEYVSADEYLLDQTEHDLLLACPFQKDMRTLRRHTCSLCSEGGEDI